MKEIIDEIARKTSFDNMEIQYYIEKTDLKVTQEFLELILNNLKNNQSLETAVNLAAGIIKQNQFDQDYLQQTLISIGNTEINKIVTDKYYHYVDLGFTPKEAIQKSLEELDTIN
jgi:hypothetical protein